MAGTATLLEAARAAGVDALVFASTNAVVGHDATAGAISEASAPRPLTPYGATKAAGEMLMSAYTASYGLRCACLRLTNVYGPGMQAKDSIVARLMRAIQTGATFEIYGDGLQVRDYVNVDDVTEAVRLALTGDAWRGPVVIGSRDVAVGARGRRGRAPRHRRAAARPPRPGQAGRDARRDRRQPAGQGRRLAPRHRAWPRVSPACGTSWSRADLAGAVG